MEQPSTSYGGMGGSLWRHRQQCAESLTPSGCTEGSFLKLECHTEPNEFGVPVKRCIRLHQRLRYCPGQPPMPLNEKQEILTLAGEDAEKPLLEPPFAHGAAGAAGGAGADRGGGSGEQGLEELYRIADELHDKIVPDALQLAPRPPPRGPLPYSEHEPHSAQGLLSRLKSGWQARQQAKLNEKAWLDYAKEFQEV